MLTVFVFVMNVFSLPGVILICCSEFYFVVTVVGHRTYEEWDDVFIQIDVICIKENKCIKKKKH